MKIFKTDFFLVKLHRKINRQIDLLFYYLWIFIAFTNTVILSSKRNA